MNHVEHFQVYCVVLHDGNALGTTVFCSLICEWLCFYWVIESEYRFLDVLPTYHTQNIIKFHKLASATQLFIVCECLRFYRVTESESDFLDVMPSYPAQNIIKPDKLASVTQLFVFLLDGGI